MGDFGPVSNTIIRYSKHKISLFLIFFSPKFCRYEKYVYLCITKNDGAIAQLVEQRTENPCVPGSTPGGTTKATYESRSLFLCSIIMSRRRPHRICILRPLVFGHPLIHVETKKDRRDLPISATSHNPSKCHLRGATEPVAFMTAYAQRRVALPDITTNKSTIFSPKIAKIHFPIAIKTHLGINNLHFFNYPVPSDLRFSHV